MQFLQKCFYSAQIKMLLALSPPTLFHKISQLEWYKGALQRWINDRLHGSPLRALDVGCATGYLTEYMNQKGHDVSGVDLSKNMIKKALKRASSLDFLVADARNLPFENERFDLISAASVINITPNPPEITRELFRVCKVGGWATFLFPVEGFTDEDLLKTKRKLNLSGFSEAALIAWHKAAPKKSVHEIKEILKNAGFSPCETKGFLHGMLASVSAQKDS